MIKQGNYHHANSSYKYYLHLKMAMKRRGGGLSGYMINMKNNVAWHIVIC